MKRMIGVLLAALALDAGTKWLASELLAGRTVALGWLVELRLTRNDGMALGLFAGMKCSRVLDEKWVRRITSVLLVLSGVSLIAVNL